MPSETIIRTVFSNGLQVKLKHQPYQRTINLGVFVAHGAKDEDLQTNGIAHYIEHVLFNPAYFPRLTKKLVQTLTNAGALNEAYTSKEYTRYTITCVPDQLESALQFLSHTLRDWQLYPKAIEHERTIILHEHAMHFSSNAVLGELLDNAFWGDRSLGLFVIGRKNNIQRFSKQELGERMQHFYIPERTHVVALGPVDPQLFEQLTLHLFGSWNSARRSIPDPLVETEPSISSLPTSHPRTDLLIGYLGVPFMSSDRYAVELLADILGGGMHSRLFLELREKHKLAYLVHAYATSYAQGGYLAIKVNCDKAALAQVYAVIQHEVERIKTDGIREDELARVKATRTTALLRVLENSSQHLQLLGRHAVLNDDFFIDLATLRVASVDVDQVARLAREVLIPDRLALVALGPREEELLRLI